MRIDRIIFVKEFPYLVPDLFAPNMSSPGDVVSSGGIGREISVEVYIFHDPLGLYIDVVPLLSIQIFLPGASVPSEVHLLLVA